MRGWARPFALQTRFRRETHRAHLGRGQVARLDEAASHVQRDNILAPHLHTEQLMKGRDCPVRTRGQVADDDKPARSSGLLGQDEGMGFHGPTAVHNFDLAVLTSPRVCHALLEEACRGVDDGSGKLRRRRRAGLFVSKGSGGDEASFELTNPWILVIQNSRRDDRDRRQNRQQGADDQLLLLGKSANSQDR